MQGFTHHYRYGNIKYLDEAMDLGVTTLVAWGVESEDVAKGPFREIYIYICTGLQDPGGTV